MSCKRLLPVLVFLASALTAYAQTHLVEVDNWRVEKGDNPAYAQPDFNAYQQHRFAPSGAGARYATTSFVLARAGIRWK